MKLRRTRTPVLPPFGSGEVLSDSPDGTVTQRPGQNLRSLYAAVDAAEAETPWAHWWTRHCRAVTPSGLSCALRPHPGLRHATRGSAGRVTRWS